jgi:2-oxoglutarate/2-oxoacid ferredoxin oxidoreductase subunit beta
MTTATLGEPLATYRNERAYPFCPGCGHGPVLDRLDEALVALQIDPRQLVVVSDIGCSGLSDQYFATGAFHGLHGRCLTYATGIKLARPELEVVVVMGDGGAGIGGAHLLNAARRNIGLTLLVLNNFNYGMTGGQHSATTPPGALTATTPDGNLEQPLDLCATVAVNGASYAWRGTSFDGDLAERIAEAIRTPGFALLDVWELCTAHYLPRNQASRRTLAQTMERLGFPSGVRHRAERPELAAALRAARGQESASAALAPRPVPTDFASRLDRRLGLVLAGAAGARVRSAARLLSEAAVASGLWAAQRDDYPVTVQTGYSISEIALSPEPIEAAGGDEDAVLVLSPEGRTRISGRLARLAPDCSLFLVPAAEPVTSPARYHRLDAAPRPGPRGGAEATLWAAAAVAGRLELFPREALEAAVERLGGAQVERQLAAVRSGFGS